MKIVNRIVTAIIVWILLYPAVYAVLSLFLFSFELSDLFFNFIVFAVSVMIFLFYFPKFVEESEEESDFQEIKKWFKNSSAIFKIIICLFLGLILLIVVGIIYFL